MTLFKFFRKIANSYRSQKWGWVVIIASWIILIPIVGVFSSFGIFLSSLSAKFNATKFEGDTNKSKTDLKTSKTLHISFPFSFSLFGVGTERKYSPFDLVDFVFLRSSNPSHVFSRQNHPPSPLPSSFPSTSHRHLHHPFFPRSLLSFSRDHTSVTLHPEVCLSTLQFSRSLLRIRFLSCRFLSLPVLISPFSTLQLPFFPPVLPSLPPFPFHKAWLV